MRIGTDIVELSRIARAIENGKTDFLDRVYTWEEKIKINTDDPNYERAAGFWAAKEAAVKAVGYGFREGIKFHDIEITHDTYGCPSFNFSGRLKKLMAEKGLTNHSLTLSHCQTHAIAVVVLYK
ncbi:holo-[acyl-carrier protein] synthase [Izhakiella capsodis]|uniref:Holo-[acyl-carrier-protein] synthase n=1 Tax=Izhakiella capsodis TaxID=1367852 RepID=A0A1I4XFK7_9GAMM|nr:holo-ACP synthase [Izhakiella capsodis]SFN24263.1 holo-[acyl-carrier protein] synthase [Izhakiella capsodis]